MHNYAETYKDIWIYNLRYNFDIAFAIAKISFCGALLEWEQGISKR